MNPRKKRIIEISDEILQLLLKYKEQNTNFTFSLRSRESAQSKEERLRMGQWFQGSNYLYVPFFRKGDSSRKIKTLGFVLEFDSSGRIKDNFITVSFKSGRYKDRDIEFHCDLAKLLEIDLNDSRYGRKAFKNPENYLNNLSEFLNTYYSDIITLLKKHGLYENERYIYSEEAFQKNLDRIAEIKKTMGKKYTIEEMEQMFTNYLQRVIPRSTRNYLSAVSTINKIGVESGVLEESLYEIQNLSDYDNLMHILRGSAEYEERNKVGHGMFRASLKKYEGLLTELENSEIVMEDPLIKKFVDLLLFKRQIIFQGPPGTGKTFTAKNVAEKIIFPDDPVSSNKKYQKDRLEKSGQFKLVQFHPSYTYDDFVRGIVVKKDEEVGVDYVSMNKIFGQMCSDALDNYNKHHRSPESVHRDQWIDEKFDEFIDYLEGEFNLKQRINLTDNIYILKIDEDCFRYKGNDWNNSSRINFKELKKLINHNLDTPENIEINKEISLHANYRKTYYRSVIEKFFNHVGEYEEVATETFPLKQFVLIIDEINRANLPSVLGELIYALEYRDESVQTMYEIDGDYTITIPDNLLIIGTMNTADRSVGHIDYAIKRRFSFASITADRSVIVSEKAQELFDIVSELFVVQDEFGEVRNSDHLAADFDFRDVQIGHSYFILKSETTRQQSKELQIKLDYEIIPLLREYVKDGLLLDSAEEIINQIEYFEC